MEQPIKKIGYYADGKKILTESWFNSEGKYHNPDGPAFLMYDKNGYIISEKWYINGKLHNENGPAVIDSMHGYEEICIKHYYLGDVGLLEDEYNDILHISKQIHNGGRDLAILNIKHDCLYIRNLCEDILNGNN